MLTYTQIRQWVAEHFHEDPADTALTNLFLRWTNQALEQIASVDQWKWLEAQGEFTLGTDGAGANTGLGVTYFPHFVHSLISAWPSGRGYRDSLVIIGAHELDMMSPAVAAGTLSNYLAVWGYYGVERDNPTTGVLAIADAGAGTGVFRVEGIDQNGYEVWEDVTLVAGAGVTVNQYVAGPDGVRRFYHHTGVTGITTLTSGGVQIARLNGGIGEVIKEHLRTELSPAPAAGGANYVVRYYKRIRPVRDVTDMVDVPFEFEDLVFFGVGRRLAEFRGSQEGAMYYEQLFASRARQLRRWQNRVSRGGQLRGRRLTHNYGFRSYRGY